MKNRFVRLLRMGLPGLVLAALAGCAAPVGPEETSAPETQVYTVGGVELALPEAEGRFTVVPHPEEGAWRGENLLGVYETESYERGLEEDGRLWGSLFTLVRYEAADYESLLAYGTEPEAFARDADGRYYSFTDTDGSLYRGEDGPTPEEEARWAALQETIPSSGRTSSPATAWSPLTRRPFWPAPSPMRESTAIWSTAGLTAPMCWPSPSRSGRGRGESGAWSGGTGPAAAPAWCSLSRTARPPPRSTPRGRRNGTAATYPTTRRRARPSTG